MYSFAEKDYRFKAIFSIQIEFLKTADLSSTPAILQKSAFIKTSSAFVLHVKKQKLKCKVTEFYRRYKNECTDY